ncbi:MAG TPA: hypothetical protein EYQ46_15030, partial [Myxococcales bacterium]|nr:hypothetical protein [Myxococcales bacterium]
MTLQISKDLRAETDNVKGLFVPSSWPPPPMLYKMPVAVSMAILELRLMLKITPVSAASRLVNFSSRILLLASFLTSTVSTGRSNSSGAWRMAFTSITTTDETDFFDLLSCAFTMKVVTFEGKSWVTTML